MKKLLAISSAILLAASFFMISCTSNGPESPENTGTPTATPTITVTSTFTATPTVTATSTNTPVIITATFQKNASYDLTKDTRIMSQNPTYNYGILDYTVAGYVVAGPATNRALLFFNIELIPSNAVVTETYLTVKLNNRVGAPTLNIHRISEEWDEGLSVGGASGDSTWNDAKTSQPWASGSGGSFDAPSSGTTVISTGGNGDTKVLNINNSLVQGWVTSPATNFGMLVKTNPESPGDFLVFYTKDSGLESNRPKLTVKYYIP